MDIPLLLEMEPSLHPPAHALQMPTEGEPGAYAAGSQSSASHSVLRSAMNNGSGCHGDTVSLPSASTSAKSSSFNTFKASHASGSSISAVSGASGAAGAAGAAPGVSGAGASPSCATSTPNSSLTPHFHEPTGGRKRSNSRSQVISLVLPSASAAAAAAAAAVTGAGVTGPVKKREHPEKRTQMQYIVTLIPLNETFIKKNLLVPYFPDSLKLGRPAGSKVKPEINNGYFDSRVLSRNHASMFIDPVSGNLMIKDLGSSNGTFVNEVKIGLDPVELKIGDVIYLGFNIEVDTNHKKISAKIENINIMPNFLKSNHPSALPSPLLSSLSGRPHSNGNAPGMLHANNSLEKSFLNGFAGKNISGLDLKHYNFIQSIFEEPKPKLKTERNSTISFENALFGDVNPTLEDTMLGLNPKGGIGSSGIFNNSQITNSVNLEQIIVILANNLSKIKQQNSTLKSFEDFLERYQSNLNDKNQEYLTSQFNLRLKEYEDKVADANSNNKKIKQDFDNYKIKKEQKVYQLEQQIVKLRNQSDKISIQLKQMKVANEQREANEAERAAAEVASAAAAAAAAASTTIQITLTTPEQQEQQEHHVEEKSLQNGVALPTVTTPTEEHRSLRKAPPTSSILLSPSDNDHIYDSPSSLNGNTKISKDSIRVTPPVSDDEPLEDSVSSAVLAMVETPKIDAEIISKKIDTNGPEQGELQVEEADARERGSNEELHKKDTNELKSIHEEQPQSSEPGEEEEKDKEDQKDGETKDESEGAQQPKIATHASKPYTGAIPLAILLSFSMVLCYALVHHRTEFLTSLYT